METLFLYLLKSSAIIALFFLAYYFLLRKETFFNSTRWFLLLGLITSVVLPLLSIKKIVYIEKPNIEVSELIALPQEKIASVALPSTQEITINWFEITLWLYGIIAAFLVLKVLYNSLSLYKLLYQRNIQKENNFLLVDIDENVAPFSFFNFIVYNSKLYSEIELQSILSHEKIHSEQKHSLDVLIAKLFSIVFWFNPFIHWYKHAIAQNLEYIADQKAIESIQDKTSYQLTLLKVVSHQNCLPITNHFYQPRLPEGRSLIKKRIVMLNTNQSHQRNAWKYTLVIPALIAFVFLFQVKTIAQERNIAKIVKNEDSGIYITTHKNSTDAEMKKDAEMVKEKYGVTLKYTKVKRNDKGEITGIKVTYKDKDGNTGTTQLNGNEPIKPIHFYKTDSKIGFGKGVKTIAISSDDNVKIARIDNEDNNEDANENTDFNFDFNVDGDVTTSDGNGDSHSRIIIKKEGKNPIVIINGKVIEGNKAIDLGELEKLDNLGESFAFHFDDDNIKVLSEIDIDEITNKAFEDAQIQIKRIRPEMNEQIRKEMAEARRQMSEARAKMSEDMRKARSDFQPEMEKARAEMEQARAEMLKAKADMEKAKAELEKAKTEMKK